MAYVTTSRFCTFTLQVQAHSRLDLLVLLLLLHCSYKSQSCSHVAGRHAHLIWALKDSSKQRTQLLL